MFSQWYASLHCDEYGLLRTWYIYNVGKTLYRDLSHVVEFLLQLRNKVETTDHVK